MGFKWKDYQKAVSTARSIVTRQNIDLIDFMFENCSNREEEGFEEAWEAMMNDVMVIVKAEQEKTIRELKKHYQEIKEEAQRIIDNIENGSIPKDRIDGIQALIKAKKAGLVMKTRVVGLAEKWAKPNWLKRTLRPSK